MRAAGWWPIDVSITEAAGLILACALLVGGIVAPLDVSFRAQRAIAVFLFAVVLWLTKPLPLSISSVLSVTLLAALGVVDSFGQAASGFASRLVFFLLLLFLLGGAISKVGIDEHVAARLMSAQSTPRESYGMLSRNVLLLAFLMPSGIARTVTFVPVVSRLNERYDLDSENNFLQSSFLMLGQVNPIASLALMTGGGMALLSSEIIRTTVRPLTWLDWALYMVPPVIVLYLLSAVAIARLYPIDDTETVMTNDGVDVMSRDQHLVGAVMLGTIGLWLTGSIVDFSTIVPPMLAVMVLAAPGVSIITAQDVREANWGILLLFGAVLSLIDVLATTGAMDLLVDSLLGAVPLMAFSRWTALGVVLVGVVGFRLLFSTASACLAIVLPVVITLSETLGVDPMYMSLSVVLVVGATTLLPFHLPTVLIVAERYPELRNRDVFLVGGITLAFAVLTVYLSWTLYWPMLA
jgi:anion transporter